MADTECLGKKKKKKKSTYLTLPFSLAIFPMCSLIQPENIFIPSVWLKS